ncbi:MAG: hypothetical protein ABIS86_16920 [Streptosporangiaceae bacterium]
MIALMPNAAYLSETSRMLEPRRALTARGADTRIVTHGGTHENLIEVPYDLVEPRMDAARCARFVRDGVGLGAWDQSMYSDAELRAHTLAEAEYFRRNDVDTAVTGFALSALLSTRLAGVRLVTEHAGVFVPPVVGDSYGDLTIHCGGFNRVAADLGVEPVPSLPALLMGDLTLVPELPEVTGVSAAELEAWSPQGDPRYRQGTRLRYTGPLFARLDLPLPPDLEAFLKAPGPVVHVAITSSPAELVRAIVAALLVLDGVRVLVAATVHDLADLACDRVRIGGVLPSHRIMPRVDLAVTAGGQGRVQAAMAGGAPLLGIPLQPEQELNVGLLEKLGAARRLAPAELARDMLATDTHRLAAEGIRDLYAAVDGPGLAAEAILSDCGRTAEASTARRPR